MGQHQLEDLIRGNDTWGLVDAPWVLAVARAARSASPPSSAPAGTWGTRGR
jgi:hypothetical protein